MAKTRKDKLVTMAIYWVSKEFRAKMGEKIATVLEVVSIVEL
jgi:hypothetical protein